MKELVEGIHYYINEQGYIVFTREYHLENGSCCGNGCLNCPFDFLNVPEPRRTELKKKMTNNDETA